MSKWIFVTGGSGFLGANICAQIKTLTDYSVMLIDRRSQEFPHTTRYCDVFADENFASDITMQAIRDHNPFCVIHCADSKEDPLYQDPMSHWDNNLQSTLKLLKTCASMRIKNFIFTSTTQVYADNDQISVESSDIRPIGSHAASKLFIEHALRDCYLAYGMNSLNLRISKLAGAHYRYDLGELYKTDTLMSNIMESALFDKPLMVYGNNWSTPDGTQIRDYLHINDASDAILAGIDWLKTNVGSHTLNLSSGLGVSVKEIIEKTENILSSQISYKYVDKQAGNTASRIADNEKIKNLLNWSPKRSIDDCIRDAFKWTNSQTYKDLKDLGIWYK